MCKYSDTYSQCLESRILTELSNQIVNSTITYSGSQPLSTLKQLSSRGGDGYGKKEKTYA